MTNNTAPTQAQIDAWKARQQDTSWGRVLLQAYCPFYWIVYAVNRRTITPWLHGFGFAFAAAMLVSIINTGKTEQQLEGLGTVAGLIVSPIGYKIGTDSAREFAKKKLEEAGA